ncbi:MAG: hypothetical protein QHH15_00285 [Candidatus Thermoplasmatota archaeon]|nr:hypothetical protein [Candidatus Thermoplasmatota archaeon]
MSRDELCSNCQDILKDMVIVKPDFMKYLFIKADISENELNLIQKENEKAYYPNHHHHTTIKKEEPTFRADRKKGEGKAAQKEVAFRQEMLDRLKECYDDYNKLKNNTQLTVDAKIVKLKPITDKFAEDCKAVTKKYIPDIWNTASELAKGKLKELGIEPVNATTKREEYNSLMKWQLYKCEMNAEYLRLDLTNKLYGNNYFRVTYGK